MITRNNAYTLAAALAAAWIEEYDETATGVHSDRAAAKLARVVGETAGSGTAEHLLSDYGLLTVGMPDSSITHLDPNETSAVIARWEHGRKVWHAETEGQNL